MSRLVAGQGGRRGLLPTPPAAAPRGSKADNAEDRPTLRVGTAPSGETAAIEARRHLIELSGQLLGDPVAWYTAPNPRFGGERPIDLIDTEREVHVYNLLRAADQGLT